MEKEKNAFAKLYGKDMTNYTKQNGEGKDAYSFLSWSPAWATFKQEYPDADYGIIYDEATGLPYKCDPNTGYMVFTWVRANGETKNMWLPVLDVHHAAMKIAPYNVKTKYSSYTVQAATMFDINSALMRCLVKNIAMFGLGLYLYAGEDVPESVKKQQEDKKTIVSVTTVENIKKEIVRCGLSKDRLDKNLLKCKVKSIEELSKYDADQFLDWLSDLPDVTKKAKEEEKSEPEDKTFSPTEGDEKSTTQDIA